MTNKKCRIPTRMKGTSTYSKTPKEDTPLLLQNKPQHPGIEGTCDRGQQEAIADGMDVDDEDIDDAGVTGGPSRVKDRRCWRQDVCYTVVTVPNGEEVGDRGRRRGGC
ncbi:uncharacterized protein [Elaeis guineensis]|uniref:uncharacterized protein n=1 Tax=Elaeis guineensis var. tenera TaxID=51953 RepID=UPI003C6D7763